MDTATTSSPLSNNFPAPALPSSSAASSTAGDEGNTVDEPQQQQQHQTTQPVKKRQRRSKHDPHFVFDTASSSSSPSGGIAMIMPMSNGQPTPPLNKGKFVRSFDPDTPDSAKKGGSGEAAGADLYEPGDIVWSKLSGFPWWPALIYGCHSENGIHTKTLNSNRMSKRVFFVYFYGKYLEYSWVSTRSLLKYSGLNDFIQHAEAAVQQASTKSEQQDLANRFQLKVSMKKRVQWDEAIELADRALTMTKTERIKDFGELLKELLANQANPGKTNLTGGILTTAASAGNVNMRRRTASLDRSEVQQAEEENEDESENAADKSLELDITNNDNQQEQKPAGVKRRRQARSTSTASITSAERKASAAATEAPSTTALTSSIFKRKLGPKADTSAARSSAPASSSSSSATSVTRRSKQDATSSGNKVQQSRGKRTLAASVAEEAMANGQLPFRKPRGRKSNAYKVAEAAFVARQSVDGHNANGMDNGSSNKVAPPPLYNGTTGSVVNLVRVSLENTSSLTAPPSSLSSTMKKEDHTSVGSGLLKVKTPPPPSTSTMTMRPKTQAASSSSSPVRQPIRRTNPSTNVSASSGEIEYDYKPSATTRSSPTRSSMPPPSLPLPPAPVALHTMAPAPSLPVYSAPSSLLSNYEVKQIVEGLLNHPKGKALSLDEAIQFAISKAQEIIYENHRSRAHLSTEWFYDSLILKYPQIVYKYRNWFEHVKPSDIPVGGVDLLRIRQWQAVLMLEAQLKAEERSSSSSSSSVTTNGH